MTILISLLVLALVQNAAQNATAPPRPATLGGRVTDRESGAPVPRAIVRITRIEDGGQPLASGQPLATTTDEDGRWELHDLPPGEYRGFVELGQFRENHVMEMLRTRDDRSGRILLRPGETRTDLNATLPRALAITVRVVDQWGEPLSRLSIAVIGRNGNRVNPPIRSTDDRGLLRIYGLQRGTYVVCADPRFGGAAVLPGRDQLVRTCYPSAVDERSADPVVLDSDLEGLVITMRRGRTARISGTVVDAAGAPVPLARVSLTRFERDASGGGGMGPGARDGRFEYNTVVPGDYGIAVEVGGPNHPEDRRKFEAAFVPLHVTGDDIQDLVVTTAPAAEVAGKIVLEDTTREFKRDPGYGPILVFARLANDDLLGTGSSRIASVADDRSFVLDRMFGRRTFEAVNIPRGWYVKSIRYGGKEAIDTPADINGGDGGPLEIVLSTRGSTISGKALDEAAKPQRGAQILLFPADRARWKQHPTTTATAREDGTFRVGPVRDGDYLIVAVPGSSASPYPDDHEALSRLATLAERVTLAAEEERTLDLRAINVK